MATCVRSWGGSLWQEGAQPFVARRTGGGGDRGLFQTRFASAAGGGAARELPRGRFRPGPGFSVAAGLPGAARPNRAASLDDPRRVRDSVGRRRAAPSLCFYFCYFPDAS